MAETKNMATSETQEESMQLLIDCSNADEVRQYLTSGGDSNLFNKNGESLLFAATRLSNHEAMQALLEAGANVNEKGTKEPSSSFSPNKLIIDAWEPNIIIRLLSSFRFVMDHPKALYYAVAMQDVKATKLLLQYGADANAKCWGLSPLHMACFANTSELAELLLDAGAIVNEADEQCSRRSVMRPLYLALFLGRETIARLLVERGANVQMVDESLRTPLHVAAMRCCVATARLLLERGAEVDVADELSFRPLQSALKKGSEHVSFLLRRIFEGRNADDPEIVIRRFVDMVELLLKYGADPNYKCFGNNNSLHLACGLFFNMRIQEAMASDEVEQEQMCEGWTMGESGMQPGVLDVIAQEQLCVGKVYVEVAELLLRFGADANAVDQTGMSPLHMAVQMNELPLAELLIAHGANVNARDKFSKLILHYAVRSSRLKMVQLLLDHGARAHEDKARLDLLTTQSPFMDVIYGTKDKQMITLILEHDLDYAWQTCCFDSEMADIDWSRCAPFEAILMQYVALVKQEVCQRTFLNLSKKLGDMLNKYQDETTRMRQEVFYEGMTHFELLCTSHSKLSMFLRNENLKQAFEASDFTGKYPLYEKMMRGRMARARKTLELEQDAEETLALLFGRNVPYLISQLILRFLSRKDLHCLKRMRAKLIKLAR